jgi:hypothetical protein
MFAEPKPALLEEFAALGLERIVLVSPFAELATADETLQHLDSVTPLVQEWAER